MFKISTNVLRHAFSISNRAPHQILGVRPYATVSEIKQAFFKLAKTHHPDVSSTNSTDHFTNIRIAYEELLKQSKYQENNKKPRQNPYQQANNKKTNQGKKYNSQSNHNKQKQNSKKPNNSYNNFNQDYEESVEFEFEEMQLEDMKQFEKAFASYINNGYLKKRYSHWKIYIDKILGQDTYYSEAARRQNARNKKKEAKKNKFNALDLIHHLTIDVEELGSQKKIQVQRKVVCKKCEFYSQKNYVKIGCTTCKKTGIDENYEKCKQCLGKGYHRKYECKACQNKKFVTKVFDELIVIPLGINNGEKIVLTGRGHQHVTNGNFGDLVIVISLASTTYGFSKTAKSHLKISIADAVLGMNKKINTQRGIKKVYIPAGVQDGEVIQLDNMIKYPQRTQEYIKISINIPNLISDQEKKIYQKLRNLQNSQY